MDADLRSKTPGVVQVRITLAQEGSKYKEVIKRKTKHHEVVEVDGFNFRRKRKAITPSPPHLPAAAAKARHSPATAVRSTLQLECPPQTSPTAAAPCAPDDPEDDAVVADQSLVATEAENQQSACETELQQAQLQGEHSADVETIDELITEADDPPADVGDDADDAAAGVFDEDVVPATPVDLGPLEFSMAPSELCYLAQWVLTSQLKKLPNMTADAAGFAAADIAKKFAQLLQQRQSSSPEQPSPGPPAAGGAQAATVEDGQQQAATQQQQEDEPAAERGRTLLQSVTVLPHQFEQLKSAMRNKLDRLLQEEAAWLQLLQQYNDLAAGASSSAAHTNKPTAVGCAGSAATENDGDPAAGATAQPTSRQQQHVLKGVALKAEMLTALVSKMEQLVSNAEAAARSLQAAYHVERFKNFPHVNSPAVLIRSIISSQQPVADGSE